MAAIRINEEVVKVVASDVVQVNNGFTTIAVSGQDNVVSSTASDTLTLAAGSNVTITTDATTDTITIAASGGGGSGNPGGTNTQVQFNDSSSFGGDSGFTYNKTTDTATVGNIIDSGLTASRAVVSNGSKQLTSATTTAAELEFVSGVTSAIQTQIDIKAPTASPTFTGTVTIPTPFTLGAVSVLPTGTELNFVDGVTSNIQTQLDGKQTLDATLTALAGVTTAADKVIYATGSDTFSTTDLTAAARTVLDDTTVSAMLDTLGGASATGSGGVVRATSPTLVTPALGTPSSGTLTNCTFPTLNQDTTGTAAKTNALNSATTVVNVSSATAPTSGQVLTATSSTAATWQTPSGGVSDGDKGDITVTASGATWTADPTIIAGKTTVTAVGSDYVLIGDTSDSGNLKKALISDFASAGGDMAAATYDPANIAQQLVGTTATQTVSNKTLTAPVINSGTIGTSLVPTSNDGAALGNTTNQFSDLFLAEGGVINFDNGDATITQTANDITVAGITTFGVGTSTALTTGTIELGHASDTTIARVSAGVVSIEGVNVVTTSSTDTLTNKTLTSPTLTTPVLGTPSSGTLTNCTGLPVSGITASTSTALGVGSIELGHASDTSIARVSAGVVSIEGVNIVTTSSTDTLTNKTLTSPTLTTPVLGTPSSGTLTNCTGLPVAGITASTSTALGVGSIELGHASDTSITRVSAGVAAIEGSNILTASAIGSSVQAFDADLPIQTITFVIDGSGATITTGIKGDLEIPFACTIQRVTALADQSGSIVVDIWKDTYANFPPLDADSITASAPVTISSATKSQDSTLTGWTTSVSAGDILRFNVDSVTSIQRLTISLKVTK